MNRVKRYICGVKKSLLGHDLQNVPISVNDRVIFTISRGFYFHETSHAKFHENKSLAKISEFTVVHVL